MQIYLARNSVQAGPYTLEQLNTMLASGEVLLTDLVWHEGMEEWKQLGYITNGHNFYDPNGDLKRLENIFNQAINEATIEKNKDNQGNDNTGQESTQPNEMLEQDQNRVTVDQLYGRKPTANTPNSDSTLDTQTRIDSNGKKSDAKATHVQLAQLLKIDDDLLANRFQRVIASLIDWVTIVMICLPIFIRIDMEKLNEVSTSAMTMAEKMAASQELAQQVPPHIAMMCNLLFLGFLVVQTVLLLRRGQTVGKLVMGIRILDFKTHELASPTKVLLLRSIVTIFSYLTIPLLVLVDVIYMLINRNRRSIHDKLAGTYVAKAKDEQITKASNNKK